MSYIATTDEDRAAMLAAIGARSVDDLFAPIPAELRLTAPIDIAPALDQIALGKRYAELASRNADSDRYPSFLGAGVYDHYVPPTVGAITGRSEFYTSYTPYQPEVSQGTLQSIYEFQTLIAELYDMDLANASMYDASTGLAEAAIMASDLTGRRKIVIPSSLHPSHSAVIRTYLRHMDLEVIEINSDSGVMDPNRLSSPELDDVAAVLVQQPNFFGNIEDMRTIGEKTHAAGALFIACADPVSLGLLCPPGAYGVDIAVGEGQALGCPMGYGGPLLGLFACKKQFMRRLPGRIVGATRDLDGRRAFVMTLRTREQDIRRERATSNICTNVALYALAATVHLATMGPQGMRRAAELCTQKAHYAASQIAALDGYALTYPKQAFFKEFSVDCPAPVSEINAALWRRGIIGGYPLRERRMLLAVTERRSKDEIDRLVACLAQTTTQHERNGYADGPISSRSAAAV